MGTTTLVWLLWALSGQVHSAGFSGLENSWGPGEDASVKGVGRKIPWASGSACGISEPRTFDLAEGDQILLIGFNQALVREKLPRISFSGNEGIAIIASSHRRNSSLIRASLRVFFDEIFSFVVFRIDTYGKVPRLLVEIRPPSRALDRGFMFYDVEADSKGGHRFSTRTTRAEFLFDPSEPAKNAEFSAPQQIARPVLTFHSGQVSEELTLEIKGCVRDKTITVKKFENFGDGFRAKHGRAMKLRLLPGKAIIQFECESPEEIEKYRQSAKAFRPSHTFEHP